MSRNLVYVNGQNESVTFETGPYLIVKIEGLGIPNIDRQEQKAPYQDGTTYIDSLLQNRDIVVELAITKPNDFANIALYRRELSQRLCPKYGLGTLTYTDEDGNAYNIRAVVSSMVFPNKDFRDPYMRAMVTFTACDPYWKDVTTDSISLPTSVTSAPATVNGANSNYPSVIQLSDGSLFIAYRRASDGYLVSRIYTTSWSAEAVINAASSLYSSVIERADGSLFIAYQRVSDSFLVSRIYTTSWSAESVINASDSYSTSVIERADGSLFIAYRRASDGYLVSRAYVTSWGVEVVINPANSYNHSVIERADGSLLIVYARASDSYLVSRAYVTGWSAESVINAAGSGNPSLIERSDGSLFVAYRRTSTGYLMSLTYLTTWSNASIINATDTTAPSAIELSDNSLFIAYIDASAYVVSVTRSVTPVPAVITGDVPAPFLVTFNGPSVNPRIINQNTLEYIRLNTTLAATDSFVVDTSFGNKTVKLTQGGIVKNGIAFLDIGSTFFQLDRPTLPALPIGVDPWYGNVAYYAMDNIPEIPDDPAGVTYLQDAWATVDGWAGRTTASVATVESGNLKVTFDGTDALGARFEHAISTWNGKQLRAKITSATPLISVGYYNGSAYVLADVKSIISPTVWIVDFQLSVTAFATLLLQVNPNNTPNIVMVDWIYIGTGAYLPNSLLDSSGNANHGRIYGATPDGAGGIIRDGINDYEVTVAAQTMPDIFHYHEAWTVPNHATQVQTLFAVGVGGAGRLRIYRDANGRGLVFNYWNGSVDVTVATSLFFPSTTLPVVADITVNWLTGAITICKDGVFFAVLTMTLAVTPAPVLWYFGNQSTLFATQFAGGTVSGRRWFNRALSAEEVLYLYNNPDVAIPADATVVYYEDDAVLSTATATMEWTERYVGL